MGKTTNKKQWFVILQQAEIEKLQTPAQIVVFASIKSYSANGKREIGLSQRDIAGRARLTQPWIIKIIPQLIELDLIKITGEEKRRGGAVPTYKVITELSERTKSDKPVITKNNESDNSVAESDNSLAWNPRQSKKVSKQSKKVKKNKKPKKIDSKSLDPELRLRIFHELNRASAEEAKKRRGKGGSWRS